MAAPTMGKRIRDIIGDSFGADVMEASLDKALADARTGGGVDKPKTTFFDPVRMFMGTEFLDAFGQFGGGGSGRFGRGGRRLLRPWDLRRMAANPVIGSIIQTRINQMSVFAKPQITDYDLGYRIMSDDEGAQKDDEKKKELTMWLLGAGQEGFGEESFEIWMRKFMRDSMILDQGCSEVVMQRDGDPAYFVAVDGATIFRLKESLEYWEPNTRTEFYAQVIDGVVETRYTREEMMFGIRNPQTDLFELGYGLPELEVLTRTVTAILNTERFNFSQVGQGGTSKGVFVVRGAVGKPEMDNFKEEFKRAVRNAGTVWNPPVLHIGDTDGSVDWKQLDRSNRDMEWSKLFEFLIREATAIYQIDPAEVNWSVGQFGATTTFESSTTDKVLSSQQRGLRPLLRFVEQLLNSHVVKKLDDRYFLKFMGLNTDQKDDIERRSKEVTTYKTVNEVRTELGMESLPGGDIILNQFYAKALGMEFGTEIVDGELVEPTEEELAERKKKQDMAEMIAGGRPGQNGKEGEKEEEEEETEEK